MGSPPRSVRCPGSASRVGAGMGSLTHASAPVVGARLLIGLALMVVPVALWWQPSNLRGAGGIPGGMTGVRQAVRGLLKAPVFTGVAVLSLALGIGANTAMFGLVDQVLLRRLPVPDPQELVQLRIDGGRFGSNSGDGTGT